MGREGMRRAGEWFQKGVELQGIILGAGGGVLLPGEGKGSGESSPESSGWKPRRTRRAQRPASQAAGPAAKACAGTLKANPGPWE